MAVPARVSASVRGRFAFRYRNHRHPPQFEWWVTDGFRIRVECDGDRVRLITRGGYDWTKRYPWIAGKKLPQSMLISRGTPSCPDHEKQMQKQMRSKPNLRKQSGDAGAAATALTHRERQILRLVSEGLSNKEIGRRLKVTDGKIKVHLHNIFEKLWVSNRRAAEQPDHE